MLTCAAYVVLYFLRLLHCSKIDFFSSAVREMTDETRPPRYFTVVDSIGWPSHAMEYWAATPSEGKAAPESSQLRRFIKLIGSGENLSETGDGMLKGIQSRQTFYRFPAET